MSTNANLHNKNFNIIETKNTFDDILKVYSKNDNKNVVEELKGSFIISLTNDKNEIMLCSDKLYNLSPRFDDPIYSTIDKNSNTTVVKLNYNNDHFSVSDSKLELNNSIMEKIKNLEDSVAYLTEKINNLIDQDSNCRPVIAEDIL